MSLRTNLLGFCHYLPGTQLREERGRLQGRLPGSHPHCTPRVSLNASRELVAFPVLPCLMPCACPKALLCLEGEFFSWDQNPLDLTMPGGLEEDTFLCASSGGF